MAAQNYHLKSRWKLWLLIAAMVVVALSLAYTSYLAQKMREQERQRMEMVGMVLDLQSAIPLDIVDFDFTKISNIIASNKTIPMLMAQEDGTILDAVNYGDRTPDKDAEYFQKELELMKGSGNPPIILESNFGGKQYVYFRHSTLLQELRWFPLVQLGAIALLIFVGFVAFSTARRAEQNQVWVGLAKETAHQLGTPISSLIGWSEALKAVEPDNEYLQMVSAELDKDVQRLSRISERFSKIGANPELQPSDIVEMLERNLDYMKLRASRKIKFSYPHAPVPVVAMANINLLDWVIENLLRNALDAMDGNGQIAVEAGLEAEWVWIEISDTGKGIPKNKWKTIFQPGYTTKKRGWGLGLSLALRIVEEYHNGKIFVKKSSEQGTTFRVMLRPGPSIDN